MADSDSLSVLALTDALVFHELLIRRTILATETTLTSTLHVFLHFHTHTFLVTSANIDATFGQQNSHNLHLTLCRNTTLLEIVTTSSTTVYFHVSRRHLLHVLRVIRPW